MTTISRTLALLKPADLFQAWKWIDIIEESGEIEADAARLRKEGILRADGAVEAGAG